MEVNVALQLMHLAPGLRIPNGLPKERDLVSISHKIILNAIEDEERRDHVDPDVDYSFYKPTAFHDVRTLQLSFHSECANIEKF